MANYKRTSLFHAILELSKVKITFAVSFTTITGYVLGKGGFDFGFVIGTLGIFLLACGASVINHIQEQSTDLLMERTRERPLPSGRVNRSGAILLVFFEVSLATILLYIGAGVKGLVLAWIALIWYNLIYTNLKKVTVHAVIPGSVIGSIPPLVGWVMAGQDLASLKALVLAIFFFVWQVPHFYLLALKYGDEYKKAGMPAMKHLYRFKSIIWQIYIWILITACCAFSLYYFELVISKISLIGIIISSVWIVYEFSRLLEKKNEEFSPGKYFMKINYYVLVIVLILNLDHLLSI